MSRCVIVSGAEIGDYAAVRKYFKNDDFNIFCDCGLRHQKELGIKANLIVGDFDSYTGEIDCEKTIKFPVKKDYTDSALAIEYAIILSRRSMSRKLFLFTISFITTEE